MDLHIDIETFSSVDLKECGVHRYVESIDFEILLIAYSYDDMPINIVDLAQGENFPEQLYNDIKDKNIRKHAHNASFERLCFQAVGLKTDPEDWYCSAVKSAYCGLPLSLGDISKALKLEEDGKDSSGKALIKYFCVPCKPSKVNGQRTRNLPRHDPKNGKNSKNTVCRMLPPKRTSAQ